MYSTFPMQLSDWLARLPLIKQTRRNHALEHATIHVLSARVRGLRMAGRSDERGFVLFGDVDTDTVTRAVSDALSRLRRGEAALAIHPNCGTNLVATSYLASLSALLTLRGASRRDELFNRLPLLVVAMIATQLIAPVVGTWLQQYVTTDGNPADTEVMSISRREVRWLGRPMVVHRIETRSS